MTRAKRVNIDEEYHVLIDNLNHTLYRHDKGGVEITFGPHRGKLSKPKDIELAFFPNMKRAVCKVMELKLLEKDGIIDLQEYINELKGLGNIYGGKFGL